MCNPPTEPRVWGIIPAAGLSRRFGRPKQLLPFQGSTTVGTVVRTLLEAHVSGVVVVTRTQFASNLGLPVDPRVRTAINDDDHSEMIDSIRIGLATLNQTQPSDNDGVLVIPGDMPLVTAQSCEQCMAAYRSNPGRLVIAMHGDQRGHPIIFPFSMRHDVRGLTDGLNTLPQMYPTYVLSVTVDDPGVNLDIDTPEDLGVAR